MSELFQKFSSRIREFNFSALLSKRSSRLDTGKFFGRAIHFRLDFSVAKDRFSTRRHSARYTRTESRICIPNGFKDNFASQVSPTIWTSNSSSDLNKADNVHETQGG